MGLPSPVTSSVVPPAASTRSSTHSAARLMSAGSPPPVEIDGIRSQSRRSSRRASAMARQSTGVVIAILLALGAALSWGTADYLGGTSNRRAPLFAVGLLSQGTGVAVCVAAVVIAGRGAPNATALAYAAIGGIATAVALSA